MNTDLIGESKKCRKSARKIFKEVEELLQKASIAADSSERYELYIQAMDKSKEAHSLMAKARELASEHARLQRENLEEPKINLSGK